MFGCPESAVTDVILGCRMSNSDQARPRDPRRDSKYGHVHWAEACIDDKCFRVDIRDLGPQNTALLGAENARS